MSIFFNDTATTEIYTLSLHDALPISAGFRVSLFAGDLDHPRWLYVLPNGDVLVAESNTEPETLEGGNLPPALVQDRKSTRLNSSHANISYAVFCLKKETRSIVPRPEP